MQTIFEYQKSYTILYLAVSVYVYQMAIDFRERSKLLSQDEYSQEVKLDYAIKIKRYQNSMSESSFNKNSEMGWVFTTTVIAIVSSAALGNYINNKRIAWCAWYCSSELIFEAWSTRCCWLQRRSIVSQYLITAFYSIVSKTADKPSESSRKVSTGAKVQDEALEEQVSPYTIAANFFGIYALKAWLLYNFVSTFYSTELTQI